MAVCFQIDCQSGLDLLCFVLRLLDPCDLESSIRLKPRFAGAMIGGNVSLIDRAFYTARILEARILAGKMRA
jgi:hypothetical protein